jgi:D-alanyl-D-alanine dipeptidase
LVLRVRALAACWLLASGCGSGALERSVRAEAPHGRDTAQAQDLPLSAACAQTGQPIVKSVTQLVVVTSSDFDAWRAQLQRYARAGSGAWRAVGEPIAVVLGRAGYAWGDGVHGSGAPDGRPGPLKREGDGRSPAGVFAVGTVHGYATAAPDGSLLPYEQASAQQRCVDDPRAPEYNRIVEAGTRGESWRSAERMRRDDAVYELALDIEHNRAPVVPGHGSCIFAHVWVNAQTPVAGCTGMPLSELKGLLIWLKPGALWVSLPIQEYQALRACWDLPASPNQG